MCRLSGHTVECLGAQDLRGLEPALSREIAHGVFLPETARATDPYRLVSSLADHFSGNGGKLVIRDVSQLAVDGQALIEAGGTIRCHDMAVVAASVWSGRLLADPDYRAPLVSQRSCHVTFEEPEIARNTVVMPVDPAASIAPMAMGIRTGHTVEFARPGQPANRRRNDALNALPSLGEPSGREKGLAPLTVFPFWAVRHGTRRSCLPSDMAIRA